MNFQLQIVTWNSKKEVTQLMKSINQLTKKPTSIVFIDNNSTDGTKEFLNSLSGYTKIFLTSNTGFCHAHNIAFQEALRNNAIDAVILCNPDVILQPNALKLLEEGFKRNKNVGSLSGILLRPETLTNDIKTSIVDSAGIEKKFGFRFINRREGHKFDERDFSSDVDVFANSGACMMIAKSVLQKLLGQEQTNQVFDERFFAYKEDIDLGWRLRKMGYRNICIGKHIGSHERHVKKSVGYIGKEKHIIRLSFKNHRLLVQKNYSFKESPLDLLGIVFFEALKLIYFLFLAPSIIFSKEKASTFS